MGSPLYRQIAADVHARIVDGHLKVGDRIPTEKQLVQQYGCHRNTVKRAYDVLVSSGVVEHRPGRYGGMVVRGRKVLTFHASFAERPGAVYGEADAWHADVRAQGLEPSQTFECRDVELPDMLAAKLRCPDRRAVLRRCIRSVDGKPSSIQDTYYPAWLAKAVPELRSPSDMAGGTTKMLADRGYVQTGYLDTLSTRMATPEEAGILHIGVGTPVLIKTRLASTADRIVRLTNEVSAGDTNEVEYEVGDIAAIRSDQP